MIEAHEAVLTGRFNLAEAVATRPGPTERRGKPSRLTNDV